VKASSLSFKAAVLFAMTGMAMGIAMAATHDHSAFPAHAHLNLLGWVSLFLIGIYYRFNPSLDMSRSALVQVVVWILGTIVLTNGVAAIYLGSSCRGTYRNRRLAHHLCRYGVICRFGVPAGSKDQSFAAIGACRIGAFALGFRARRCKGQRLRPLPCLFYRVRQCLLRRRPSPQGVNRPVSTS
jgi:hypothetical protein